MTRIARVIVLRHLVDRETKMGIVPVTVVQSATFATAKPWTQRADATAKTVVVQGSEMQTAGATVLEFLADMEL